MTNPKPRRRSPHRSRRHAPHDQPLTALLASHGATFHLCMGILFGGVLCGVFIGMIRPLMLRRDELLAERDRLEMLADQNTNLQLQRDGLDTLLGTKRDEVRQLLDPYPQQEPLSQILSQISHAALDAGATIQSIEPIGNQPGRISQVQEVRLRVSADYAPLCRFLSALQNEAPAVWVVGLDARLLRSAQGTSKPHLDIIELTLHLPFQIHPALRDAAQHPDKPPVPQRQGNAQLTQQTPLSTPQGFQQHTGA